jgi:hypothetical protein
VTLAGDGVKGGSGVTVSFLGVAAGDAWLSKRAGEIAGGGVSRLGDGIGCGIAFEIGAGIGAVGVAGGGGGIGLGGGRTAIGAVGALGVLGAVEGVVAFGASRVTKSTG